MGISSRIKMIKNYIGWRKENKGRNFTSLFTVGDRNKIKVGDYTYGRLNVAMWDAPDESLSTLVNIVQLQRQHVLFAGGARDERTLYVPVLPEIFGGR